MDQILQIKIREKRLRIENMEEKMEKIMIVCSNISLVIPLVINHLIKILKRIKITKNIKKMKHLILILKERMRAEMSLRERIEPKKTRKKMKKEIKELRVLSN